MICSSNSADNAFNNVKACMKKYDLVDGSITGYKIYEGDV